MRKLVKKFGGLALLLMLSFLLSSSTPHQAAPDNDEPKVEIIKGGWFLKITDCEGQGGQLIIPATSSTWQKKFGVTHIRTTIFDLPDGHCRIPEKAKKVVRSPTKTWLWTPSGKLIVKVIDNPLQKDE